MREWWNWKWESPQKERGGDNGGAHVCNSSHYNHYTFTYSLSLSSPHFSLLSFFFDCHFSFIYLIIFYQLIFRFWVVIGHSSFLLLPPGGPRFICLTLVSIYLFIYLFLTISLFNIQAYYQIKSKKKNHKIQKKLCLLTLFSRNNFKKRLIITLFLLYMFNLTFLLRTLSLNLIKLIMWK